MPSMIDVGRKATSTYASVVDSWEKERKTLGTVQPYTAKKAAEKARALLPWLGKMSMYDISPSEVKHALIELRSNGGRSGDGLSSSTLRAGGLLLYRIHQGQVSASTGARDTHPRGDRDMKAFKHKGQWGGVTRVRLVRGAYADVS